MHGQSTRDSKRLAIIQHTQGIFGKSLRIIASLKEPHPLYLISTSVQMLQAIRVWYEGDS
jgi:hypothetical protein